MRNDYRQIIAGMRSHPWLITEESLEIICEIVNKRLSGEAFTDEEIRLRLQEAGAEADAQDARVQVGGGVGVLSLVGPIFPKANLMTELSGATSLEAFRNDLKDLVANDAVKQIVMDIDSPGGSAFMIAETGRDIRKAREIKPVYAVANTIAASGALWLGSQATKFYATESGKVGSLGVYTVHEDISGADEKQGRKITFISAGEYKTEGNEHEPLSDKARAHAQSLVDETMQEFVEAVAVGRGLSVDEVNNFANGKIYNPKSAKEVGMIDDVLSLDDLLSNLVTDNFESRSTMEQGALAQAVKSIHTSFTGGELSVTNEAFTEPGDVHDDPTVNRDDAGDDDRRWRRDTPPAGEDPPYHGRSATVTDPNKGTQNERTEEGGAINLTLEEQLNELRTLLGVDEKGDVVAAVKAMSEELKPLQELKTQTESKKKFAEEYPEEAKRLAELEQTNQENFAKSFGEKFENRRVIRKVGDGDDVKEEPTSLGLSALVLDGIQTCAKEFSESKPTFESFSALLDALFDNGIVDYGNKGSTQVDEEEEVAVTPGTKNARVAFAEAVEKIQKEDELNFNDALVEATKRHPKLAEAWRESNIVAA